MFIYYMVKIELFRNNQIIPIKTKNNLIKEYNNAKKILQKENNQIKYYLSNENFYLFPMNHLKFKNYKIEIYNNFFILNDEYYPYIVNSKAYDIKEMSYSRFNNNYIFKFIDIPKKENLNYVGMMSIKDNNFKKYIKRPFKALHKYLKVNQKLNNFNIFIPNNKNKKIKDIITDRYIYTNFNNEINVDKKFDLGLFFLREFVAEKPKEDDLIKRFDLIIKFILTNSNKDASFIIEYFDFLNNKSKILLNKLVQNFNSVVINTSFNLESISGQLFIYCNKFNPSTIKVNQEYINNNLDNFNLLRINNFINKFKKMSDNIINFENYQNFKVPKLVSFCYKNNIKVNPIFKFKLSDYYILYDNLDLIDLSDLNLVYHHVNYTIDEGIYCENMIFLDFLTNNFNLHGGHFNYISSNTPDYINHNVKYWITNKKRKEFKLKERSNNWFIYIINQ